MLFRISEEKKNTELRKLEDNSPYFNKILKSPMY